MAVQVEGLRQQVDPHWRRDAIHRIGLHLAIRASVATATAHLIPLSQRPATFVFASNNAEQDFMTRFALAHPLLNPAGLDADDSHRCSCGRYATFTHYGHTNGFNIIARHQQTAWLHFTKQR